MKRVLKCAFAYDGERERESLSSCLLPEYLVELIAKPFPFPDVESSLWCSCCNFSYSLSWQAYHFRSSNTMRLLCNGYYPEVLVVDPNSFEIVHTLCCKVAPDWISACCHIQPPHRQGKWHLAFCLAYVG